MLNQSAYDRCLDRNFILPRWQLLYSKRNIYDFKSNSVFSKNNLLSILSRSQASARTLVKFIFLDKKELLGKRKRAESDFFDVNQKHFSAKRLCTAKPDGACLVKKSTSKSAFLEAFGNLIDFEENHNDVAKQSKLTSNRKPIKMSNTVDMFGPSLPSKFIIGRRKPSSRGIHIPKYLRRTIVVCQTILQHTKQPRIHYLFEVHCKIPPICSSVQLSAITDDDLRTEIKNYLMLHSSVNEVFLFLRSVIKRCFSKEVVWGNCENELAFFKNLKFFLSCCRFDKITVNDLCLGISLDSIPWLKGPKAKQLFCKFIKWLLLNFVFEIVTRFFYVTEHSRTGHKLYFYRKDIWMKIVSAATELLVRKNIWTPVTSNALPQFRVRFCPKHFGVRPIMKQMNKGREGSNLISSYDILKILQYICKKHPSILGYSVINSDQIHVKWKAFWRTCVSRYIGSTQSIKLYFVKMDVDSCFDTIVVELLLHVLQEILDRSSQIAIDHLLKGQFMKVSTCSEEIYDTLERSLKDFHLDVMGTTYVKVRGIPQGWNLSSLLCNIFYGDLESKNLQEFMKPKDNTFITLLMRFMDDYLFVSTEKNEAIKFVKKMEHGFVDYGMKINWTKTCCNFPIPDLELSHCVDQIRVLSDDEPFSWFGLLFPTRILPQSHLLKPKMGCSLGNSNHGGVSIDLSRYSGAANVRNSVTIHPSAPDYKMYNSLSRGLRLRVATICFDLKVNSHVRVLRNIYELGVLTACKWLVHSFCRPKHLRVYCSGTVKMLISRLAIVLLVTMRKKLPEQKFPNRGLISWVFLKAFYQKLARYASCFDKVRARLLQGMLHHEKRLSLQQNWNYNHRFYMRFSTAFFPKHLAKIHL